MKNKWTIINNNDEDNLRIKLEDKGIIFQLGFVTHNGNKIVNNLLEQDLYLKEQYKSNILIKDYGWDMQRCKWDINLLTMLEMFGKEQFIINQDKISFGLNTHICKNC